MFNYLMKWLLSSGCNHPGFSKKMLFCVITGVAVEDMPEEVTGEWERHLTFCRSCTSNLVCLNEWYRKTLTVRLSIKAESAKAASDLQVLKDLAGEYGVEYKGRALFAIRRNVHVFAGGQFRLTNFFYAIAECPKLSNPDNVTANHLDLLPVRFRWLAQQDPGRLS